MTRQLYKCLDPAFNSKEQWESFTLLSSDAKVELDFWWEKIRKLNSFFIGVRCGGAAKFLWEILIFSR